MHTSRGYGPTLVERSVHGAVCARADSLEERVASRRELARAARIIRRTRGPVHYAPFDLRSVASFVKKVRPVGRQRLPPSWLPLPEPMAPHYLHVCDPVMSPAHRAPIHTQTRDVSARGARVRFVEAGDGPPLLLIHGYLSSHVAWDDVLPRLARRVQAHRPRSPGLRREREARPGALRVYVRRVRRGARRSHRGARAEPRLGVRPLDGRRHRPDAWPRTIPTWSTSSFSSGRSCIPRGWTPSPGSRPSRCVGPLLFKQLYGRVLFRNYFRHRVYGPSARGAVEACRSPVRPVQRAGRARSRVCDDAVDAGHAAARREDSPRVGARRS